jgi:hypothetical protein
MPKYRTDLPQLTMSTFMTDGGLEKGAKRFVDGISDDSYKSGIFYASKAKRLTGQVIDQSAIFPDLNNSSYQDNANAAIHRFIK